MYIAISIIIAIMLILILISEFFLRFALLMTEKKLNQPRREEDEEKLERDANAAFLRSSEDVYIDANDGIRLHAYFHGGTAGKFLISLHGYTGRAYENGIFYIDVPEDTDLEFNYMGFKSVILPAKDNMLVVMEEDRSLLEESVVVGYGSLKKKDILGSVSTVRHQELQNRISGNMAP